MSAAAPRPQATPDRWPGLARAIGMAVRGGAYARLSHAAAQVWTVLAMHADHRGLAWPSISTLERETGLSRSAVCSGITGLIAAGLIHRRAGDGASTTYIMTAPPDHGGSDHRTPRRRRTSRRGSDDRTTSPLWDGSDAPDDRARTSTIIGRDAPDDRAQSPHDPPMESHSSSMQPATTHHHDPPSEPPPDAAADDSDDEAEEEAVQRRTAALNAMIAAEVWRDRAEELARSVPGLTAAVVRRLADRERVRGAVSPGAMLARLIADEGRQLAQRDRERERAERYWPEQTRRRLDADREHDAQVRDERAETLRWAAGLPDGERDRLHAAACDASPISGERWRTRDPTDYWPLASAMRQIADA